MKLDWFLHECEWCGQLVEKRKTFKGLKGERVMVCDDCYNEAISKPARALEASNF